MFKKLLAFALLFAALSVRAATIGGDTVGWTLDFDQVSAEQKKSFGWFDDELKTAGWKKFSINYSTPGTADWTLRGKVIALHATKGPAFFSIVELLEGSTVEEVKKTHYRSMSDAKGFKEAGCSKTEQGAQSCEVAISNWSPAKSFYAVFYEWKAGERSFVLVVRNSQPTPDRKTPEEAAKALISLIK